MRREVLEVMAEEIASAPVGVLASFLAWDGDGRRRLDGMSKGRRWDIDREQRDWERANAADLARFIARASWRRWEATNPARARAAARRWVLAHWPHLLAYRARWARANAEKERVYDRRQMANTRANPLRLARYQARQERHLPKKRDRAKQRYWSDVQASRARNRQQTAKYYASHREEILARRRKGPRRQCTACGQLGHNRRRHQRASPPS